MKKQLLGISIILFGILLGVIEAAGGFWIPIIEYLPWDILGLFAGIIGLIIVAKNTRQDSE